METFLKLSQIVGCQRMAWRYDPILLTKKYTFSRASAPARRACIAVCPKGYTIETHFKTFERISECLISVSLQAWMELTKTSDDVQEKIRDCMMEEIIKGKETGFAPYQKDGKMFFWQRWLLTIGMKP
jgi:hypothetical protein